MPIATPRAGILPSHEGQRSRTLEINEDGASYILSADGTGGLWFASRYGSGSWNTGQMDTQTTTDLGGMYFNENMTNVSYIRGGTHLYAIEQYRGC